MGKRILRRSFQTRNEELAILVSQYMCVRYLLERGERLEVRSQISTSSRLISAKTTLIGCALKIPIRITFRLVAWSVEIRGSMISLLTKSKNT